MLILWVGWWVGGVLYSWVELLCFDFLMKMEGYDPQVGSQ